MLTRRLIATASVLGFLAVAVVLLLSDRVGGVFDEVISLITRGGRKIERDSGVNLVDRSDIPGRADQIIHVAFWGTGMLIIGWAMRKRIPVVITALFVAGISLLLEMAQPMLSASRQVDLTDAAANIIGITLATAVLVVLVTATRQIFGDDRRYYGDQVHVREDTTDEMFIPFR